MFLIRMLLFIFLLGLLAVGFIAYFVYRQFHQAARQFRERNGEQSRSSKQTVVDRRDPGEAHKKIIPEDEGEYVDFEEEG